MLDSPARVPWLMVEFIAGAALAAMLGRLLPDADAAGPHRQDDPADRHRDDDEELAELDSWERGSEAAGGGRGTDGTEATRQKQMRLGVLMMIALSAHNLPEGLAVAVSASESRHSGTVVAIAIAMHNIPEGLAIAVPIFAATRSRRRALAMTLASGLSEPAGALVGLFMLRPLLIEHGVDDVETVVGGVMSWLAGAELLPEAHRQRRMPWLVAGFACGWLLMAVTLQVV